MRTIATATVKNQSNEEVTIKVREMDHGEAYDVIVVAGALHDGEEFFTFDLEEAMARFGLECYMAAVLAM